MLPSHLVTVDYLLLWCNCILEACWLRHSKNSKWLEQHIIGLGVAHFKVLSRR